MIVFDVIKRISWLAQKNYSTISVELGHSRQYINSIISKGSIPRVDTLVDILRVCGYVLCTVPKSNVPQNAIVIDNGEENEVSSLGFAEIIITDSKKREIDLTPYEIDFEQIEQEKTPASHAQILFNQLWKTGELSSNAYSYLVDNSYAYGRTYEGEIYYLGACRDFNIDKH